MYLLELAGDDDAFAVREAASRCSGVELLAPGLAIARGVRRPETLAYTRRVCRLVGTCDPAIEDAVAVLQAASFDDVAGTSEATASNSDAGSESEARPEGAPREDERGAKRPASPATRGTVAVRARDVRGRTGVDTRTAERRLGQVLVDRGLTVDLEDPDHTLVALFSETAAVGWLAAESRRDFGTRQPTDKPFFQPGSMDPMDARALANVAGAAPGTRLVDPMCGTGGILVEAGLAGADVVGVDAQRKMVEGARENLAHYLDGEPRAGPTDSDASGERERPASDFDVVRGDATRLPFAERSFDAAVFDAPYGRQSKIEGASLEALVGDALGEVRRVARRAVLVGDRPWNDAAAAAGWDVESRFDRRVHRSLTRYVHVLE